MKNRLYKRVLAWSFIMIILGLILGIYSREILRLIDDTVEILTFKTVQNELFLGHGHFIFLGGLLPLGLLFAAGILKEGLEEKQYLSLNKAFTLFMIGTTLTLALSVYKNSATVIALMKNPQEGLGVIDKNLFGGSVMLRSILLTLAHPLMGTGVIWFILVLRKRMKSTIK